MVKKGKQEEEKEDGSESEVEEGDIQALARSSLREGEEILGEGVPADQVEPRGICNAAALLQKLKDIEYKVPEGAKRVPWVDTLLIEGQQGLPKGVGAKDGVKLEGTFMQMGRDAVREAYRRLKVMKIPCSRPTDFYAEMLRTDKQMYKVRSRASEEQRRMRIVEDRKKSAAAKKFAKKAKTKKQQVRAEEKRQTLEDIKGWQGKKKGDKSSEDKDLDAILDRQQRNQKGNMEPRKKGMPAKSKKREMADQKFGFGGKKKRSRQNDTSSVNDFDKSPWGKGGGGGGKGKGKVKGKGKGGKGKGKGKGGGKGVRKGGGKRKG